MEIPVMVVRHAFSEAAMQQKKISRTADATPHAAALIEGLRDIGYSLETAISDVIDNSITANAKIIQIISETYSEEPYPPSLTMERECPNRN